MIEPHGGELVDQVVDSTRESQIRSELGSSPTISLTANQFQDVINIATGRYSPLKGFLSRNDFLKVVHDKTLEDGTAWPLPIVLDVGENLASELTPDERAGFLGPQGRNIGSISIQEVYKYNKEETAELIYGTKSEDHPGVAAYYDQGDYLVGGSISLFSEERYNEYDLLPAESRVLFAHLDWDTVVGFQTRNAPHRAHEYIQKTALEQTDGLLVQPKLGEKKEGDYKDEVIMGSYQELTKHYYPENRVALSVFPSKMRYAGPREAIFDAIVRKNQGCTHFVVGRDHAGVADYYGKFAAQEIFTEIGDIRIEPMFFTFAFYCSRCDGMASEHICPHGDCDRVYPSGSSIRKIISNGQQPSEKQMRSEITEFIGSNAAPFVTKSEETNQ